MSNMRENKKQKSLESNCIKKEHNLLIENSRNINKSNDEMIIIILCDEGCCACATSAAVRVRLKGTVDALPVAVPVPPPMREADRATAAAATIARVPRPVEMKKKRVGGASTGRSPPLGSFSLSQEQWGGLFRVRPFFVFLLLLHTHVEE